MIDWDAVSGVVAAQRERLMRPSPTAGALEELGDGLENIAARHAEFEAGRASHTAPDASAAASRTAPAVRPSP